MTELIVKQFVETLKKKNKGGVAIKPFQIKNHMWIFVNCLINNPAFDSQTKENMTLQAKSFGSKCTLTDKFITSVSLNICINRSSLYAHLIISFNAIADCENRYRGSSVILGEI